MEVKIESMVCLWDDKIPTMFLEFVNLLTLATSEEQLRRSVKNFAEKHGLDRFFLYGFGSHHFYLHQRYTSDPWKSHTNLTHPGKYFRPSKVKIMRPTSPK